MRDGDMSGLFWAGTAYLAGMISAFMVFAIFHAGGNRRAEEELEVRELAAMKASRRATASEWG